MLQDLGQKSLGPSHLHRWLTETAPPPLPHHLMEQGSCPGLHECDRFSLLAAKLLHDIRRHTPYRHCELQPAVVSVYILPLKATCHGAKQ